MRGLIRICMRKLSIDQMNYFVRASKAISYILISFFLLMRILDSHTWMMVTALLNSIFLCIHFIFVNEVLLKLIRLCKDPISFKCNRAFIKQNMENLWVTAAFKENESKMVLVTSGLIHLYMVTYNIIYLIRNNNFDDIVNTLLFVFHIASLMVLGYLIGLNFDKEASIIMSFNAADDILQRNDKEYYERFCK